MADTSYLVLRKDGAGAWAEVEGTFAAPSAKAAVAKAAVDQAAKEGGDGALGSSSELVAVPARSWTPMKVAWEATPNLRVTRLGGLTATTSGSGARGATVGGGTNG